MNRWSLPAPLRAGALPGSCDFCLLLSPDALGLCTSGLDALGLSRSGLTVSLPRFGLLFLDKICGAWAAERCKIFSIINFLQESIFCMKTTQRACKGEGS